MSIKSIILLTIITLIPYQALGAINTSETPSLFKVSKTKIEACMSDYQFLCSQYNKIPDIVKCFKLNWDKVSLKCKETK